MNKRPGVGTGVIILNDHDEVLLGQRVNNEGDRLTPIFWTAPGGRLDYEESWQDCAIRETREECGIIIEDLEIISVSNDIIREHGLQFTTVGFKALEWSGRPKVREPDTIDPWRWFGLDNLPSSLFLPTKNLIVNFKSGRLFRDEI